MCYGVAAIGVVGSLTFLAFGGGLKVKEYMRNRPELVHDGKLGGREVVYHEGSSNIMTMGKIKFIDSVGSTNINWKMASEPPYKDDKLEEMVFGGVSYKRADIDPDTIVGDATAKAFAFGDKAYNLARGIIRAEKRGIETEKLEGLREGLSDYLEGLNDIKE